MQGQCRHAGVCDPDKPADCLIVVTRPPHAGGVPEELGRTPDARLRRACDPHGLMAVTRYARLRRACDHRGV